MTGDANDAEYITVSYRGRAEQVPLAGLTTLANLAARLAHVFQAQGVAAWAPQSVKLVPKGGAGVIKPLEDPGRPLATAGIAPGARLMLLATGAAAVEGVRAARELPGLVPFEVEDARAAARRRRRGGGAAGGSGSGPHHFGAFKVLEGPHLTPPPPAALALLRRLATDPAIVAVMAAHGWRVPLLSEMPPEGRVGISAVCVLGYNVNQGQEISLRLRTDDLKGFRKYLKIRETLCHELAHNEVGPHNTAFKALNSQLLREVAAHEAAAAAPGRMLADAAAKWRGMGGSDDEGEEEEGAGGGANGRGARAGARLGGAGAPAAAPARLAAGAAALARMQVAERRRREQQQEQQQQQQREHEQLRGGASAGGGAPPHPPSAGGSSGSASASASDGECEGARLDQDEGHYDAVTAAKEREMELLGSLDDGDDDITGDAAGGAAGGAAGEGGGAVAHGRGGAAAAAAAAAGQVPLGGWAEPGAAGAGRDTATGAAGQPEPEPMEVEPSPGGAPQPAAAEPAAAQQLLPPSAPALAPLQTRRAEELPNSSSTAGPGAAAPASTAGPGAAAPASTAGPGAAAPAGASGRGAADAGALDSSAARKVAAARAALQRLHLEIAAAAAAPSRSRGGAAQLDADEAPAAALAAALSTVSKVLGNVVAHPSDPRYQSVRLANPTVSARVGRWAAARELLALAGFEEAEVGGGRALTWRRRDPGLAWLVLSVVRDAADATAADGALG